MFRSFLIIASLSQLLISFVQAHGYVSSPPSRAFLCKQGNATDCGQIQYEPQSVEAPKGLPFIWDGDGKLCSAGLSQFSQLDRQGPGVWSTTLASPVSSFNWTLTAPHATTDFKYFITKQGWNSSTTDGLYADDFDSDPFLVVPMHGQVPLPTLSHNITKLPQRSGYQVVFAVWTIDNTANAFYQCLDLDFGESSTASTTASQSSGSTTSVTSSSTATSSAISSAQTSTSASSTSAPSSATSSSSSTSSAATATTTPGHGKGKCKAKSRRSFRRDSLSVTRPGRLVKKRRALSPGPRRLS